MLNLGCHFLLQKCQEATEDVRPTDKKAKIVFRSSVKRDSKTWIKDFFRPNNFKMSHAGKNPKHFWLFELI